MSIYLRQICLVAEQLEPVVEQIEHLFGVPVCHRDPEVATFGLENALFAFGSQFLEVVAPIREGTAAGRFLERRGGPGGYMVICQATSLEEQAGVRARAAENNVRVAWESDHESGNLMQLHPRDMGAAFLEVDWDEQADPQGHWQPAGGMDWVKHTMTDRVSGITGVTLSDTRPTHLARHWSNVLGMPVKDRDGTPVIETPNAVLTFAECDHQESAGWSGLQQQLAIGPRRVAIVGAGMVGCELAEDLARAGHTVTLLDRQSHPLCGLIPPEAGQALQESLAELGIHYRPDSQVKAVRAYGDGKTVLLANGETLAVDQVIAATGLKTDNRLARQAGLAFNGGIEVNQELRSSDPWIHALGDCISLNGEPCRFIEPIQQQARTIAAAVLGVETPAYEHRPPVVRLKTRSLPLVLHGLPKPNGRWAITQREGNSMVMEQRVGDTIVATLSLGQPMQSKAA